MATPSHLTPLPSDFKPSRSSNEMFAAFVQRYIDRGMPQKVIALAAGIKAPNISNFKSDTPIPLSRVLMFADLLELTPEERFEFMTTRLIELHDADSHLCFRTIAEWAEAVFTPVGAEAALLAMWKKSVEPAPHLLSNIFDDPVLAAEMTEAIDGVVQRRLQQMADDAKHE